MEAAVTWHGGLTFTGTADTGFSVNLGAHPSVGGDNDGFRPMELLAVGLAGCTGMDVISILRKKRQDVTDFRVTVTTEQADTYPKVFTDIRVHYIVAGRDVDPAAVERAIELSTDVYCPAQAMLAKAAPITHTYEILETTDISTD